jgi:long-subunit fatty acid transport protein
MIKRLLAIFALTFSVSVCAQRSDFQMWNTLSINKEITDKFTVGIDQELRLRDNLSTLHMLYTNVGMSYKFNDHFKASLVYRFIDRHKEDLTWGIRHRIYTDLIFRIKPADFTFAYRARFQAEWRAQGYTGEFAGVPEVYMRNQVKAAYKATSDLEPYLGIEVRWQLQNARIPYHESVDRARYFAGVNYEINKHNTVGTYFLIQKEVNVIDRQSLCVWGLEYTINL